VLEILEIDSRAIKEAVGRVLRPNQSSKERRMKKGKY